jgi:hypothetical protein
MLEKTVQSSPSATAAFQAHSETEFQNAWAPGGPAHSSAEWMLVPRPSAATQSAALARAA